MKTQWMIISALLFALITAIFAVINVESVEVNFLFTQTQTPLILVILASTLLGGLTVFLFGILRQYKLQRQVRQLEKQLAAYTMAADAPAAYTNAAGDASQETVPKESTATDPSAPTDRSS
ncbi:LapA family protein [Paenibacillus abyssi]|nr:lipopolysaccharide assembly protein LapA domain-containing protein [Paenibacillus abyssi]